MLQIQAKTKPSTGSTKASSSTAATTSSKRISFKDTVPVDSRCAFISETCVRITEYAEIRELGSRMQLFVTRSIYHSSFNCISKPRRIWKNTYMASKTTLSSLSDPSFIILSSSCYHVKLEYLLRAGQQPIEEPQVTERNTPEKYPKDKNN